MKTSLIAIVTALGLASSLAACADDYGRGPYGAYADVDYDAFYDGYYGPFSQGYWGPGDRFYYYDRSSGRYRRDDGRHFRRDGANGYNPIHGHAPPAQGRPSGHPDGRP